MASPLPNIPPNISLFLFTIICIIITSNPHPWTAAESFKARLYNDNHSIEEASKDFGNIVYQKPSSVLNPLSVDDIIDLIIHSSNGTKIAARGQGHSHRGQAMARDGVVINMKALSKSGSRRINVVVNSPFGAYVDVGAEQLWLDVLKETIKHGVAPVSWTDYLHLSVGGTLSNAGISGQTFMHGPMISNVLQLDVITGKGEKITCSPKRNSELFNAVLGGLGQFGIITNARIRLDKAPTSVKWARLIYRDFSTFTKDQEFLISSKGSVDYVESLLIVNETSLNPWKSIFSISPAKQKAIFALLKNQSIFYALEVAKYYYDNQPNSIIDEDFKKLENKLHFIPGLNFNTHISLFDFLYRYGNLDTPEMGSTLSHPWLHLFIPKSRISDFNDKVFAPMIPRLKNLQGNYLLYPMRRATWDDKMSAVIPNEDVFYSFYLLFMTENGKYQSADDYNNDLVAGCAKEGINEKQYLAYFPTQKEWANNYGSKWSTIVKRKQMFDPMNRLSPGQLIFNQ